MHFRFLQRERAYGWIRISGKAMTMPGRVSLHARTFILVG